MSKKAKAEIADESAVIITDAVLAEYQAKLDSYEKSIKAALERKSWRASRSLTIFSLSFTA